MEAPNQPGPNEREINELESDTAMKRSVDERLTVLFGPELLSDVHNEFTSERQNGRERLKEGRTEDDDSTARVADFVIDALRVVEPTVDSVQSCGRSFQNQFGTSPNLVVQCLKTMTDFFLTVDSAFKLNTFYVMNELIQTDPRFRVAVLSDVLPEIHWCISSLSDKEAYQKTVSVWEERKVYPPEVCTAILNSFQAADIASKNADEFEQRLFSFIEMVRIRAAKDVALENLLKIGNTEHDESATLNAATEAAIMAAAQSELKTIGSSARAASVVTQGTIEYLSRLLVDFTDSLCSSNLESMKCLIETLHRADTGTPIEKKL